MGIAEESGEGDAANSAPFRSSTNSATKSTASIGHRSNFTDITTGDIARVFHLTACSAAAALGVCPSTLKKACRMHGIQRWPYRRLKSMKWMSDELPLRGSFAQPLCRQAVATPPTGCESPMSSAQSHLSSETYSVSEASQSQMSHLSSQSHLSSETYSVSEASQSQMSTEPYTVSKLSQSQLAFVPYTVSELSQPQMTAEASVSALSLSQMPSKSHTASELFQSHMPSNAYTASELPLLQFPSDTVTASTLSLSQMSSKSHTTSELSQLQLPSDAYTASELPLSQFPSETVTASELSGCQMPSETFTVAALSLSQMPSKSHSVSEYSESSSSVSDTSEARARSASPSCSSRALCQAQSACVSRNPFFQPQGRPETHLFSPSPLEHAGTPHVCVPPYCASVTTSTPSGELGGSAVRARRSWKYLTQTVVQGEVVCDCGVAGNAHVMADCWTAQLATL